MKLHLECIPCYVRQALDAVRMVTDDKEIQEKVLRESLITASKFDTEDIGLMVQAKIQNIVKKVDTKNDPYKKVKKKFNNICLEMVDEIRSIIESSDDPFESSLRIALAGNIIDFGPKAALNRVIIKEAIEKSLVQRLNKDKVKLLKENISKANKILYLGDNAGEIVFDKIFIEKLPKEKITYVVRGGPALNDITIEDAKMVTMTDIVKVITTGIDMPSAILPLCSESFLKEYNKSDLIISKGQGNYEALSDEIKNIFFLMKIKCPVIAVSLNRGYEVGDLVVDRQKKYD
jgi:uncharacterized protein with ATP-grasp and redox domains